MINLISYVPYIFWESGQDVFAKIAVPGTKKTDATMDLVYAELKTDSTGLGYRENHLLCSYLSNT